MRLLVSEVVVLVIVLLLVAYFTMMERKVLGYGQLRKGPNKSLVLGLGQPLLDGVKLIMKSFMVLKSSDAWFYNFLPPVVFIIMMSMWVLALSLFGLKGVVYFIYGFMVMLGFMVVVLFMLSAYSGSKFGVIGAMRSLAQMVSYEVVMGAILITVVMEACSFEVYGSGLLVYHIPLLAVWWIACVVESNRAPMDFVEGESELVSGFNVEYGSVLFAMLFLGEYGVMSLYSVLTVWVFFMSDWLLLCTMVVIGLMLSFLWWRLTYPRYRYDLLMMASWGVFLPLVLVMLGSSGVMISLMS